VDAMLTTEDSSGRRFTELFGDWLIANYLDDPQLSNGRYGYPEIAVPDLRLAAHHSKYPVDQEATVHQYAANYIRLEGRGELTVEFTGSTVVSLVGNQPHSGQYQWWSNRSDESDARLTRAFDLTGLHQATLQAWMWYDLEVDYDYATLRSRPTAARRGRSWPTITLSPRTPVAAVMDRL